MPTISPAVQKMYLLHYGESVSTDLVDAHIVSVAEHEAAHAVVAVVTMGNLPEMVTIEPDSERLGLHVGCKAVSSSVAQEPFKRCYRRAMTLLAPMVLAAPHDLFSRPNGEFVKYLLDSGRGHQSDAKQTIRIMSIWYDDVQEQVVVIRRIASRTKVLLMHPLVRPSIRDTAERLLVTPTLYTGDLMDVMRPLMSQRQSILSWMRTQLQGGRPGAGVQDSDSARPPGQPLFPIP